MTASQKAESGMQIGQLSKKTGCNIETIRYYEKRGLLPSPPRTAGGYRLYDSDHLKRLTFVMRSRDLGFSMAEIEKLLSLVDEHQLTCHDMHQQTLAHVGDIQSKIADLKRLERVLTEIASKCSDGTVPECPIIDALYEPLDRESFL
ncbi:MAG: helix-turn-helix domain-containing protein [Gammaproteobacteria bacterium]|nr:helix-turn-helix domain-containing protein [Gammaproteobacteria bacterium]